ncbi:MAG: helix-turn-helix domain-containing protein [Pseudohongiellaceae bacterium]
MAEKMSPEGQALLDDIIAIKNGATHRRYTPDQLLVLIVRRELKLSQQAYSKLLGVPVATIRDWEQGRRQPDCAAITLVKVARKHPEILREIAA